VPALSPDVLRSPMNWSYQPDILVNCRTHDLAFTGVPQTEPFFNWLGVLPYKRKTATSEETAAPVIHEGSSIP
jgi:hypothetical protein